MRHIEMHYLETARDAALLANGGFPRYDIEQSKCDSCGSNTGEVQGQNDVVAWRPFAVIVWESGIAAACSRCIKPVIKISR